VWRGMNLYAVRKILWVFLWCFLTTSDGSNYEDQDLDPCKEVGKLQIKDEINKLK
jgi:hypothetical protein